MLHYYSNYSAKLGKRDFTRKGYWLMQNWLTKSFRFALVYLMLVVAIDSFIGITEWETSFEISAFSYQAIRIAIVMYLIGCLLLLFNWKSQQIIILLAFATLLFAFLFQSIFAGYLATGLLILAGQSCLHQVGQFWRSINVTNLDENNAPKKCVRKCWR